MRQSIYNLCASPTNHHLAEKAVEALYKNARKPKPKVVFCKSPIEGLLLVNRLKSVNPWKNLGLNLWANLSSNLRANLWANLWANLSDNLWANLRANLRANLCESFSLYYCKSLLGYFLGGQIAGAKLDENKFEKYKLIAENLDWIFPYENICIVCDRPTKIGWHDAGGIHCEDGPAVEYADGYKVWALEGYLVPEQVVMSPETQTLEDIHNEENEEIRRIRINRFGWSRYITESSGEVLDVAMPRYGGMESLIKTSMGAVLCTYDPSTGRPYSLEVPPELKTCEQAQRYLLAPEVAFGRHGVDVKKIETYPLIRA